MVAQTAVMKVASMAVNWAVSREHASVASMVVTTVVSRVATRAV